LTRKNGVGLSTKEQTENGPIEQKAVAEKIEKHAENNVPGNRPVSTISRKRYDYRAEIVPPTNA
jgi:hypothetical protein